MKLKKLAAVIAALSVTLILASCSFGSSKSSSSSSSYTTTGKAESGTYQGVIKNGKYQVSKSRGVNVGQNDNQFNLKSFETGLLNVSKKVYSTKSYVFEEGQYLTTDTVENWLSRKSSSNASGLNPVKGKTNGTRNPIYIQQIEEQDFMSQSGSSLKLHGITIGIGLNSIDYYQKTTDGPTYKQKISDADLKAYGEKAAQTVLKRLRKNKALKDVPITIALYKQAANDSLVGGTFFEYSSNSGTNLSSWKQMNVKNKVYPKSASTSSSSDDQDDNDTFSNFKSQVQGFFPNLSGVTAQAQYTDGSLSGMHITVTTQFYSQTEITSFTQYITQAANKYLQKGIPIDIKIQSATDLQAIAFRDSGDSKFTTHVFDSY
ncbi:CamS sex pheromone cAM373 family protein [Paucilactobacillus oligofermentans DSM 15707 = LMG 22743]|uniref:CamS sex pheromone cAM373 family protein n=1 Tax=Paucilactobacillus oligofermentans DSM 15707 = LMG 22743 TaxID=1423778 RepID=A0A0R1RIS8_9LACO|nr:CamS sex pheromone cAM373 family protein [Paucilactobacillus oligofermentans DSM 15707 = LMG 22743]CUS25839.1 CamS sex pheromone family protein [Paucilactobacillus oligofermentans DSM 15707 = LMG 22743]